MPYTVWGAFDQFRKQVVDLDPEVTKQARSSRDYLFGQLRWLANSDSQFPQLTGQCIGYGSFARRTKIRPLDDIDFLLVLNGQGTSIFSVWDDPYTYYLKITDTTAPLCDFADDGKYVNSTCILNKIRDKLKTLPSYSRSELKKNMQAVVLNLKSYEWSFDIVPAVEVDNRIGGTAYYIIPDGHGNWIKTDPRIDAENITLTNTRHNGQFLSVMRLLKYWNKRTHKPMLQPYYFETIAIKVFNQLTSTNNITDALYNFFTRARDFILTSCPDPKDLGPALDVDVSAETKSKVVAAMAEASRYAVLAQIYDLQENSEDAIGCWRHLFGPEFPAYG